MRRTDGGSSQNGSVARKDKRKSGADYTGRYSRFRLVGDDGGETRTETTKERNPATRGHGKVKAGGFESRKETLNFAISAQAKVRNGTVREAAAISIKMLEIAIVKCL